MIATGFCWLILACSPLDNGNDPNASLTSARIALGKRLFFDARLGEDKLSCSSCHNPALAFTDGRTVSIGSHGKVGTRNAPSLLGNSAKQHFFWDGRESELESAAVQPFTNPVEMGLSSENALVARVLDDANYQQQLLMAFPQAKGQIDIRHIGNALAAYIRSLPPGDSAFDRYAAGAKNALTSDQQAGLALFEGKAQCSKCHRTENTPASFTDNAFHHLGISDSTIAGRVAQLARDLPPHKQSLGNIILSRKDFAGLGRFAVTRKPEDLAAFRTPSLRNVAVTAPYMHDGTVATLEEAVDQEIYYRGINQGQPLSLTVEERRQLAAFLNGLSDRAYEKTSKQ